MTAAPRTTDPSTTRLRVETVCCRTPAAVLCGLVATVLAGIAVDEATAQENREPKPRRETIFELPLLSDVPLPTAETLLKEQPFDWVIVSGDDRGDRLLVTEPLRLRPKAYQQLVDRVAAAQSALTSAQRNAPATVDQKREELNAARQLRLNLVGDLLGFPYEVDYDELSDVQHHEDLALQRAEALRQEGELEQAWELVTHVRRRDPEWPGLAETIDRLLFSDADRLLAKGEPERALAVLDQLFERSPRFLNLDTRFGSAVRTLALEAAAAENYRRARYYVGRLQSRFPDHPVARELQQGFARQAQSIVREAEQQRREGNARAAAEAVRRAGKISPDLGSTRRLFDEITKNYPILHVGTLRLAEAPASPLLAGPEHWRHRRLTTPRLFHERAVDNDLVRYGSDFIQDWSPEDLGRSVVLRLKSQQPRSQPQPILASYDIADALLAAAHDDLRYGDRYAATLLGVRPTRPDRLELALGVQPLRIQSFLTIPLDGPGPFESAPVSADTLPARQATGMVRFVRSFQPPPGELPGAIAEIVEHQFASGDEMVRALRRAEVDMLTDVPLFTAVRLLIDQTTRDQAIAGPCSLPETHLLQFNPEGVLSKVTELRRGLAVSFERRDALFDVFTHGRTSEFARLTTSPMPLFSYAVDPRIEARRQDRFAATALGLVGRRKLPEGTPWGPWKMVVPEDPRCREAAEVLIADMRRAGYPVELVPDDQREQTLADGSWEILYRRVQIAEPLVDLWPVLALGNEARVGELTHLPETLRRRVLELEQVDDWNAATDLMRAIDRSVWAQAIVIPLWELDRITLRRRSLREAPDPVLWPYAAVGQWRLEPQVEKSLE